MTHCIRSGPFQCHWPGAPSRAPRASCRTVNALAAALAALLIAASSPAHASEMTGIVHRVEVPDARALAVHEQLGWLAVAHAQDDRARLSIFRLNETGELRDNASPEPVMLPRPDSLSRFPHYPLALAFHPDLPVLYVWQDITGIDPDDRSTHQTVRDRFPHLIIYEIDEQGLKQIGTHGTGAALAFSQSEAALAVSRDGDRLFIPNFHSAPNNPMRWGGGIGYFDLDEKGRLVPVRVPIEGSLDGRGITEFKMKIKPTFVYTGFHRANTVSRESRPMHRLPTRSLFAPTKRAVVFGTNTGIGVWDTVDRRQALSEVNVGGAGVGGRYVAGHPQLPLIYAGQRGGGAILRIQHVNGFPTMLPECTRLPVVAQGGFVSTPVPFHGQAHGLAIGGRGRIYLIPLDENGRVGRAFEVMGIASEQPVRALDYSPRHDRLYVAVDQRPQPPSDESQN